MTTSRSWWLAGLVAGLAGLLTSYAAAMALTIRESPVVAVAELVIRWTPGPVAERAVELLGFADKAVLLVLIVVLVGLVFAWTGALARRRWWAPVLVYVVLTTVGAYAVLVQREAQTVDLVPVAVGFATWLVCLSLLTEPLRRHERAAVAATGEDPAAGADRRGFLVRMVLVAGVAAGLGIVGRAVGRGRRHVEQTRRLLKIVGVTKPDPSPAVRVGVEGVTPWVTAVEDFYLIHTAIVVPTIEPVDWRLRIHGLVDRVIELDYRDLISRQITESWITLNCVSNEVGGSLVGNAWWSGVRLADLLAEAGVRAGADAVLQTSEDGWTCATPLAALTDERNAMLAVAMNGKPLPIDHGFPVRTIVPGLYGYVSATKWVVDLEVTRFEDVEAFWTQRGWSEQGPVKIASRIDVPGSDDDLVAGDVRVAGMAWAQHTGIERVEVAVDGGPWQQAELAATPNVDTWVQWALTVPLEAGDHVLRVRATDRAGLVQTGVEAQPIPEGATGWHQVEVSVGEA
ncbi:molybdopterin-dependent oxidoreductase [Nocardioides pantholopis]|uniref:molybdopterin-dependent oxidoreductase n=1 Tax=Nocardioides pantholopis TaxID=2483798 RepID=UPI000FD7B579|nr:molybdopterin-dependent oxidoreductase [Nocardioides pantholopis]